MITNVYRLRRALMLGVSLVALIVTMKGQP